MGIRVAPRHIKSEISLWNTQPHQETHHKADTRQEETHRIHRIAVTSSSRSNAFQHQQAFALLVCWLFLRPATIAILQRQQSHKRSARESDLSHSFSRHRVPKIPLLLPNRERSHPIFHHADNVFFRSSRRGVGGGRLLRRLPGLFAPTSTCLPKFHCSYD